MWNIVGLILEVLGCVFMVYCAFTETALWKVVMDVVLAASFVWGFSDNIKELTKKEK